MPSLASLTDAYPQQSAMPVEQPFVGTDMVPPSQPIAAQPIVGMQPSLVDRIKARLGEAGDYLTNNAGTGNIITDIARGGQNPPNTVRDLITGSNGKERYQFWPEKVARSGLTAVGDALSGKLPDMIIDPNTGQAVYNPEQVSRAMDMAALAGTGGLGGVTDATLGAGPFLRPALKYGDRIYKAPVKDPNNPLFFGAEHSDAIPAHLAPDFYKKAMSGEDINDYKFGFTNHKGQFMSREDATDYAAKEGLADPRDIAYNGGILTSTMMSDSTKPGMAIESMKQPFYSATEHAVNNINQAKMTGDQWLSTIANKPGVKPDELEWTGLKDFLTENKGQPVTKEQVQQHLENNKVERYPTSFKR